LILDPFNLGRGPVAKLQSAHTGNFGFHSTFEPSA
jgi:carotenoid cleavage dioxygenase-like enzyme